MENPPKKIKIEPENDFENSSGSQQENFLPDQKIKNDPEGNFLFLQFQSPKMPKSIKREVTRKNIKGGVSLKFSKFQCKICQKYLSIITELNRHTECHFQPSSFECKRCKKIFKLKWRFDTHKCLKKSEKLPCKFCEKKYFNSVSLSQHIKKCHADKLNGLFSCDFCNEKYLIKGKLKNHLESFQCRNRQIFTCDHCRKS
jgi:hypothetical protein